MHHPLASFWLRINCKSASQAVEEAFCSACLPIEEGSLTDRDSENSESMVERKRGFSWSYLTQSPPARLQPPPLFITTHRFDLFSVILGERASRLGLQIESA